MVAGVAVGVGVEVEVEVESPVPLPLQPTRAIASTTPSTIHKPLRDFLFVGGFDGCCIVYPPINVA